VGTVLRRDCRPLAARERGNARARVYTNETEALDKMRDEQGAEAIGRLGTEQEQSGDSTFVENYLQNTEHGRDTLRDLLHRREEIVLRRAGRKLSPDARTQRTLETSYVAQSRVMREELSASCTTATELLLVEEIVSSWSRLQLARTHYDSAQTRDELQFWSKLLDSSQKRYLRALETLARVRRYEFVCTERREPDGTEERSVAMRGSA
jgi:hypothetical protein